MTVWSPTLTDRAASRGFRGVHRRRGRRMRQVWSALLGGLLLATCGCGGDGGLTPTSGTVTLDSQPLADAVVAFVPEGDTKGQGGTAVTGADGRYQVRSPQGGKGLAPGGYRVTVSKRLL